MKKIIIILILFIIFCIAFMIKSDYGLPMELFFIRYFVLYTSLIFLGAALASDFKKIDVKSIIINIVIIIIMFALFIFSIFKYNIMFFPEEVQYIGFIILSYIVNYIYQTKYKSIK